MTSILRQMININKTTRISSLTYKQFLSTKSDDPIQSHIGKLVKSNKIVVFMKGVPQAPRCGFSNAVVDILNIHKAKFEAHDVLIDENLRNGIKEYSNWPTIPQVFIDGEFIGGCDIMLELHRSGELDKILENNTQEKPVA
ncbi:glutaredoxin-related protein 5, mitochondrial [Aphis craccivora]|uniref:Glutaredoxin-related protein 5, mitochondrial n=1 Tax=Aphis craccivora TaxID=307492 RepID=A0A6G0YIH9_APHCR|nr:glutaredoxin-related protein 5, mitochondrial [Aphis craccivora]